jgi:protein-tyrosine-phosphatase
MNVLFVCTANISRSFLAEKLMQHEIEKQKLNNVSVQSAGVYARPGFSPDPKMVEYLIDNDISVSAHESRQIQETDICWADHILVMERAHAIEIISLWPEANKKVALFGSFVSNDSSEDDVIDPYGRAPYHYRSAQSQISMGIKNFIKMRLYPK